MVAVAQLVESRIVIPVVVGSSPIGHPKKSFKIKDLKIYVHLLSTFLSTFYFGQISPLLHVTVRHSWQVVLCLEEPCLVTNPIGHLMLLHT